ncbi:MAG: hypothetical protein AAGA65_09130 [Actinomycetota bacterium]
MARVEVDGLDDLLKELRELEGDIVAKQVNKDAADVVLNLADADVPRRSGALKASGRTSGTKKAGVVRYGRATVPYASAVHFGHNPRPQGGFTEPNPWLYDAADERREEVRSVYERRVDELASRF